MAEAVAVVGAAASVAGLVSLTIQLIELTRRYISSCKNKSHSIEAIHRELEALQHVFAELHKISENPRYRPYLSSTSVSKVDGCHLELERLHSRLKRYEQGSRLSKKVHGLLWPFNESECQGLIRRLKSYQSSFHATISADSFKVNVEVLNEIEKQAQERHLRNLGKFSSAEFWTNQREAWKRHEPGTGIWFLESDQYNDWLKNPNGRICIYGLPGTGKTVLCSTVVRDIEARRNEHEALVYFYYDFVDHDKQTTAQCLRSLVAQMISSLGSLPSELTWLIPPDTSQHRVDLDEQDLLTALYSLSSHFRRTYIVVDALDESTETADAVNVLLQIVAREEFQISWLVTCRIEEDTQALMRDPLFCAVRLEGQVVAHDIGVHVRKCLSTEHPTLPTQVKWKVEAALLEKAGGMFRWVDCQLESLKHCLTVSDVEHALQSLPPSLDNTYERVLLQIPRVQWQRAFTALEFIAFSKTPLTVHEISDAVVVVPGCKIFDPEDRLFLDIIRIFPSLISKTVTGEIVLAHASVKDYLTSDRILQGPAAFFAMKRETADPHIAEICLTQLVSLDEPDPWLAEIDSGAYPDCFSACWGDQLANRENLLKYSADYWFQHGQMVHPKRPSMLRSLCLNLLSDGSKPVFVNWHRIAEDQIYGMDPNMTDFPSPPSPLYYMAELGQTQIVNLLLESGVDPNDGGSPKHSPLQVAIQNGHADLVKLLLSYGANFNGDRETAGLPLFAAARRGDINTMRMLTDAGADVNIHGFTGETTLQIAAAGNVGSEALQWLLEAGADVNAQGGRYNTALQALLAQSSGFGVQSVHAPPMSKLRWNDDFGILSAGFSSAEENSDTALEQTTANRQEWWSIRLLDNLRLLLSWRADVNLSGGKYGTALHAAAAFPNVQAVQLLLEHGAKVDTVWERHGTALQAAASSGLTPILKILLEAGANVNAGEGKYGAVLQAAAAHPDSELNIRTLLDAGADINVRGGVHGSALHATIGKCSVKNMKLLIQAGADVNVVSGIHGTPLQAAISFGFVAAVKILLEAGADPTIEAGQHGTALRAAQYYQQSGEMVRLLQKSIEKRKRMAPTSANNLEATGSVLLQFGNSKDNYTAVRLAQMNKNLAPTASGKCVHAEA